MRLGSVFLLLGICWAWLAVSLGGLGLAFLWPAVSFAVLGAGYFGLGASVLAKRSDGTIPGWSRIVFGPYYALVRFVRWLLRVFTPEDAFHEVAPDLYVGRRCRPDRLPAGVGMVVDLTAELDVPPGLVDAVRYRCLPTLDGHAPSLADLSELVEEMVTFEKPIYVHCAAGHGRSAMAAAALLLRRGDAADPEEAVRSMRQSRPRIRLARSQRRLLRRLVSDLS